MSLHSGEQSWMEKIQSCRDVVRHAIEDVAQCLRETLSASQTDDTIGAKLAARATNNFSQHTPPDPPAFIAEGTVRRIRESQSITANENK